MSLLAQRDEAATVDLRVRRTVRDLRHAWVRLAEDLHAMQSGLFRALGYDTFEEWLADPEVDIERRWAYQLSATWRELVVNLQTPPERIKQLEPAKIQEVLPAVRRGKVALDVALSDVEVLSRSDLREKYAGQLSGGSAHSTGPDSDLDAEKSPHFAVCPACGSRYKLSQPE